MTETEQSVTISGGAGGGDPAAGARMLFVHAHPDDETITTGGTIAAYRARGAQVEVLTCTLGEEGEVIGSRWAQLTADRADQLGGYRIGELTAALALLGAGEPRFLGGAGHWRDSGMVDTASTADPRALVNGDLDAQVALVAEQIAAQRPHVVVTYAADGGYGHPDHIRAHRITVAAVAAAADRWAVPRLYYTVPDRRGIDAALPTPGQVPADWRIPTPGELPGVEPEQIAVRIDISAVLDRKVAALAAHATQVTVADGGRFFALSNAVAQPILAEECYAAAGPDGPEQVGTDLLAGVDLTTG